MGDDVAPVAAIVIGIDLTVAIARSLLVLSVRCLDSSTWLAQLLLGVLCDEQKGGA